MAPLRPLLAVVAVLALVVAARPADACRCLPPSVARAARAADAVFVGTVERLATDDPGAATVRVRAVWKGVVAETVIVHDTPTTCRLGLAVGDVLVFMVQSDGGRFAVRRCDGTQPTTAAIERTLTKRLGASRAPIP